MKIDPYDNKKTYLSWKAKVQDRIPTLNKDNSTIILRYLSDMEKGLNISSASIKGPRSYSRLNNLRLRLTFIARQIESSYSVDLTKVNEEQLFTFFNDMRNGTIRRKNGKTYMSVVDFVKTFKAFWHWHIKVSAKQDIVIKNIAKDLDTSKTKAKWVYLTEEQIKGLCENAKLEYRVLIMFLYDTGIRSPSELINLKVSDLYNNFKELNIRHEIVKKGSFGRRIKLMFCSDLLKSYISMNGLEPHDQIFNISPRTVNQYLQRLAKRVLGDGESLAGEIYSNLTMYDFRHCSCCYWLPRYKSESALKYRFGWKKSDKIHYYSELLGMKDTISEEDMLIDLTKTAIEKKLLQYERENGMLVEEMQIMKNDIIKLQALMQIYLTKLQQIDALPTSNVIYSKKE